MIYKKITTYLLFGVIGFTLFVAAFPASSYRYYLLEGDYYWILDTNHPIWPLFPNTEISFDKYKHQLKLGRIDRTARLVREPYPYAVGISIFLILLFTDPLRNRFEDNKDAELE